MTVVITPDLFPMTNNMDERNELFMTANTCQCEHCKEIIRQQNRLEKLQKKNKTLALNRSLV